MDPLAIPPEIGSIYPEPFKAVVEGRLKRRLTAALGLSDFGVNVVELLPGAASALRHWHANEDEFVYVLEGELVLVTDGGEAVLSAGQCAGFPKGRRDGHHLVNRSDAGALYLEVGSRAPTESVDYPDVDLRYERDEAGWRFTRKDGSAI